MKKAIHMIIKGRVQGVGFRWFAVDNARKMNVTGYVKNLLSGDVEVVAEGDEAQLDAFYALISKGPPFSHVTDVGLKDREVSGEFKEFYVEY
jgi:acylphosphatase